MVEETLAFIEREMSDTSGGFYSALDADSEGEEGKFYVWTYEELKKILGKDFSAFREVYMVTEDGNFEGRINLTRNPQSKINSQTSISDNQQMHEWRMKLLADRYETREAKAG